VTAKARCHESISLKLGSVENKIRNDELNPHEKLLGILRVSNPATRKDLADRTWGGSGTNPN